jgi:hypothetical protein
MAPELTPDTWAQIRYEYEYTERPIPDICAEHRISTGTLRDRMRRWNWTRRRPPIPAAGPPPLPRTDVAAPLAPAAAEAVRSVDLAAVGEDRATWGEASLASAVTDARLAAAGANAGDDAPTAADSDPAALLPRLQGAIARVLPAIDATLARLAAEPVHPREMEQAGRALSSLTRTLRELNTLLGEQQARTPAGRICDCDDTPEDIDEFRRELARRIRAFVASRTGETEAGTAPQEP